MKLFAKNETRKNNERKKFRIGNFKNSLKKDCERFKNVKAIDLSLFQQNAQTMFNQNKNTMKKALRIVKGLLIVSSPTIIAVVLSNLFF